MLGFNLNYSLIYTEDIPEGFGALCEYPKLPLFGKCTIKIRPKYKKDIGLLGHELQHVRQYERSVWHTLRLWLSDNYKYQCELEAYSKQAKVYGYTKIEQYRWMAEAIATKYGLKVSEEEVLKTLWNLSGC